jgi:hypothetical protein
VAREVVKLIGAGSDGNTIRNALRLAPYGWPQDAIDAVLMALHRDGTLSVKDSQNNVVSAGQLDQQNMAKRVSYCRMYGSVVATRSPYGVSLAIAGINAQSGQEEAKAVEFLDAVENKVLQSGGDAPLPPPLSAAFLRICAARVVRSSSRRSLMPRSLQDLWDRACSLADLKQKRESSWGTLVALMQQAQALPIHQELSPQVEAIRAERSLLDPTTDFVAPLLQQLEQAITAAARGSPATV